METETEEKRVQRSRVAIVETYRKAREAGDTHQGAVIAALHEVRTCSEEEARLWIREAHAASGEDDPETASAPAGGRWEFDAAVTDVFDDMLAKSIPNYEDMRRITTDAALWLADHVAGSTSRNAHIVDLGASRGAALRPIIDKLGARGRYLACDVSDPMLAACREEFAGWIESDIMEVRKHDLREGTPLIRSGQPAVILSILTLQFVPIEYRQRVLSEAYRDLAPGGGLILVEKVLGEAHETNKLIVDLYWGMKRDHGYSEEAVQRKAMALEGVLVPLTAAFDEQLLRKAGFDLVETIWAWANFRAWIAWKR